MHPQRESNGRIFGRFLRFGLLAWGGPVAQIAMIREELVDRERWIPPERFNRVLAVYQALPGPEAHELCVYFGMVAGGRLGGALAGLGFMLPGFGLMLALSWTYVVMGGSNAWFGALLAGCQPAVVAIIVRAVHRIGSHALTSPALWGIALAVAAATLAGVSFFVTLPLAGIAHIAFRRDGAGVAHLGLLPLLPTALQTATHLLPTPTLLLFYGLRSGLLTFGGAYTVISFLQQDAVVHGAWLTNAQFLDGLALGGILPAPAVIIATFVGFLGAGFAGAIAMTAGVFLPAFAFTLIGHEYVERLVEYRPAHAFLDGVTAGVVGLIAVTAIGLARAALTSPLPIAIFALALLLAFRWRSKFAIAGIVLAAGTAGLLLHFMA